MFDDVDYGPQPLTKKHFPVSDGRTFDLAFVATKQHRRRRSYDRMLRVEKARQNLRRHRIRRRRLYGLMDVDGPGPLDSPISTFFFPFSFFFPDSCQWPAVNLYGSFVAPTQRYEASWLPDVSVSFFPLFVVAFLLRALMPLRVGQMDMDVDWDSSVTDPPPPLLLDKWRLKANAVTQMEADNLSTNNEPDFVPKVTDPPRFLDNW
jgi:hypothetical protein